MKQHLSRRINYQEDRISLLPHCLLIDIISRLPFTKLAIRTGILSKRWKNLWTEVRNLIFIHHSDKKISELFSYIEKVLRQRGQLDLNKFQPDMRPYEYGTDKLVNIWSHYAFSCNVQDLNVAQSFFINSSFTHMKLDGCVFEPTGAISWTNLKSLCIVRGDLEEDLIKNILSGSPLLETLNFEKDEGCCEIDITSKSFKKLVFAGYGDYWECVRIGKNCLEVFIRLKAKGLIFPSNIKCLHWCGPNEDEDEDQEDEDKDEDGDSD